MLDVGLHFDVSAEDYHADPCMVPSLSSSVARILLDGSPRHAWTAHPRLNPVQDNDDGSARLDLGSVAHKLVLGKGSDIAVLTFDSFRTKEAQGLRDAARAAGRIPILKADYDRACDMADALTDQMRHIEGFETAFTEGDSEAVAIWEDGHGTFCRCMMDRLDLKRARLFDYKTVAGSAHPQAVGRRLFDMGYEVQAAFYERGLYELQAVPDGRLQFFFVAQEIDPPYLATVVQLDEAAMMIGRKKVAAAIELWRRCVESNNWPGYPTQVARIEMPPWVENRWLEREIALDLIHQQGIDPFLALSPWAPPPPPPEIMEPV